MALVRTKTPLRREFTGERQIDQAQDHASDAHRVLNATPFTPARGVHLKSKTLSAGKETVLMHGLGRAIVGWMITRSKRAAARVYETASDTKSLTLYMENGFVDAVVDVWVF